MEPSGKISGKNPGKVPEGLAHIPNDFPGRLPGPGGIQGRFPERLMGGTEEMYPEMEIQRNEPNISTEIYEQNPKLIQKTFETIRNELH